LNRTGNNIVAILFHRTNFEVSALKLPEDMLFLFPQVSWYQLNYKKKYCKELIKEIKNKTIFIDFTF